MNNLLVIGGGGHAKVVIDLARSCGRIVVGFCAPDPLAEPLLGAPRLGSDEDFASLYASGLREAVVAVGRNDARERIALELEAIGFSLATLVHPRAWVSSASQLGDGTVVMAGAIVNAATRIGRSVILNTGCSVDHDCSLDDAVHVAPGTHLAGYVRVGKRSLLGVGSTVGRGRPLTIGDDVTVATGSTVVHDIPSGLRIAGQLATPLPGAKGSV